MIEWKNLTSLEELNEALSLSEQSSIVIFKHSTRCSVSMMVKKNLEMAWDMPHITAYFLDLIQYREVSNYIASALEVEHQSPQLIGIKNRQVFYHASHSSVTAESIKSALSI